MSRIGIVTLWGDFNYGNRLQNYAVEQLVVEAGHEPVTLIPEKKQRLLYQNAKELVWEHVRVPGMRKRKRAFNEFNAKYLNGVSFDCEAECSGFLCGSDQIWNYTYPEFSDEMFLSFAAGRPTASISASFGVDAIPAKLHSYYRKMLGGIDAISVREETGANIVYGLTGRRAEVLADPTMAIDSKQWMSLASEMGVPSGSYALTYFLGRTPVNLKQRIQNELNIQVIVALNDRRYPRYYAVDPKRFLELLIGADVVLTDSFHGSVFSIMFGKRFVLFDRISAGLAITSRIDTLFEMFDLSSNCEKSLKLLSECRQPSQDDFVRLRSEQVRIRAFMSNALLGL